MKQLFVLLSLVMSLFAFTSCEGEDESFSSDGSINGYDYVDLGLSVKWATCNVGAETSKDHGDYFAWGETSPKATYTVENSVMRGVFVGDIFGDPQYDAATANWGEGWRMPTRTEVQELLDNCTQEWSAQGYIFTSRRNGKSIFLPAAGYRSSSSLNGAGDRGYYWSTTPYEIYSFDAYNLLFSSNKANEDRYDRRYGFSVRPVTE